MTIEAFVNILKKIDPDISRYQRIRKRAMTPIPFGATTAHERCTQMEFLPEA